MGTFLKQTLEKLPGGSRSFFMRKNKIVAKLNKTSYLFENLSCFMMLTGAAISC